MLPNAIIAAPVARGDLYTYRLLGYSHFLILDGVFANAPAISPREVVDVIRDGAVVVGASSMGALRACDCAPAGAIGHGAVFRLFRRRVISSEDEVAVAFWPEKPFPPLSEPLVNIRIALRRAERRGLLSRDAASVVFEAASALPYEKRTWKAALREAGIAPDHAVQAFLPTVDAKRADARSVCRWLARKMQENRLPAKARSGNTFGLGSDGRERPPDPLDGAALVDIFDDFLSWLRLSGEVHRHVTQGTTMDPQQLTDAVRRRVASGDMDAALMQYRTFSLADRLSASGGCAPEREDIVDATTRLEAAHGMAWNVLLAHFPEPARLSAFRETVARVLYWKRTRLQQHPPPRWRQD